MHILPYSVIRAAPKYTVVCYCRLVAGRRLPQNRSFRTSSQLSRRNDDCTEPGVNTNGAPSKTNEVRDANAHPQPVDVSRDNLGPEEPQSTTDLPQEHKSGDAERTSKVADRRFYGSWRKRATRASQDFKVFIPEWFLEKNVRPYESGTEHKAQLEVVSSVNASERSKNSVQGSEDEGPTGSGKEAGSEKNKQAETAHISSGMYQIDKAIMDEILCMASAGLRVTSTVRPDDISESKPHLILQSPKDGAQIFLESVVNHVAKEMGSDLVSIDAQDIAEIALDNSEILPENVLTQLRMLGFDTHVVAGDDHFSSAEDHEGNEEFDEEAEEDESDSLGKPPNSRGSSSFPVHIRPLNHMIQSLFPSKLGGAKLVGAIGPIALPNMSAFSGGFQASPGEQEPASTPDPVITIESFLEAAQMKLRSMKRITAASEAKSAGSSEPNGSSPGSDPQGLIVMIKDCLEMNATAIGGPFLRALHTVVGRKRRKGQPILIVGTTSSSDLMPSMSKSGIRSLQAGSEQDNFRTIVTPCSSSDADSLFTEDMKLITKRINCRNISTVLRQLCSDAQLIAHLSAKEDLGLGSEQIFAWGLDESVWNFDRVQRTASVALGLLRSGESMNADHLDNALKILESSDDSKFAWLDLEREKSHVPGPPVDATPLKSAQTMRIKQLHKTCNRHEKKLLHGVIDASSINTTFADVHAPESTKEALKTLTSLSLIRPDAFKYGVLATDKIPGLLLYGPPGTGKTLLAKAVAKESGATVLEVAGSDVYDMYVGEGEKNVRAIFTLAKKLSPCVVFIDEADAIFGSRSTSTNRTSHRELINQFLREWDGMNELSAFIMVATNRPFDLDDAVLRRLPRRLLVDLPTEKDRESILQIHLRDENLHPDVSIPAIASKTPFYSGSDLKNLSVAAALACVREENEEAARHRDSASGFDEAVAYKYPEKRTLTEKHFEVAMSEISASISEDMSSLAAIRKFDEKYGDRRGRRKKLVGSWGFGNLTESEKEKNRLEEGRVRSSEVGA